MRFNTVRNFVAAALVAIFLTSCGGKVNADSLAKIKNDMTMAEVKAILGDPVEGSGGGIALGASSMGAKTWKDGDKTISVTFMNDKVTLVSHSGF